MFENNFTGAIPREIGKLYRLRQLRMQDNQLNFNLTKLDTLGNLVNLITLDFYNNQMYGDVPASIQNLTSLQYLYLQNLQTRTCMANLKLCFMFGGYYDTIIVSEE